MFSRRKQLKRHLKKCLSQMNVLEEKVGLSNVEDTSCEPKKAPDLMGKYVCHVCGKMFNLKIGLKKHTEKAHFKTTSVWNGKEYRPMVQISLAPKSTNKRNSCQAAGIVIMKTEELGPTNLLDIPDSNHDKSNLKTQELVSTISNEDGVENVFKLQVTSNNLVSYDSTHDQPEIHFLSRKKRRRKTYNGYLKAILKQTAPKIFNDKIRKTVLKNTETFYQKSPTCDYDPIDLKSNSFENCDLITKIEFENNMVEEENEEIRNVDDLEQDLVSTMQSISITPGHKFELNKCNNSVRPSALDSSKIGKQLKDNEIRILRDEFIYRTVMAEILKNEAKIIFEKVIL